MDGRGPAGAQPVGEGEVAEIGPQGVGGDVGHDDLAIEVRRRAARAHAGADGDAMDGIVVGGREAGRGPAQQAPAGVIQQQHRAERARGVGFEAPHHAVEHLGQRARPHDELERAFFPPQQGFGTALVADVVRDAEQRHHRAGFVPERRGVQGDEAPRPLEPGHLELAGAGFTAEHPRRERLERLAMIRRDHGEHLHAGDVAEGAGFEDPQAGGVQLLHGAVGAERAHALRFGFDDLPPARFALAQGAARLLSIRNLLRQGAGGLRVFEGESVGQLCGAPAGPCHVPDDRGEEPGRRKGADDENGRGGHELVSGLTNGRRLAGGRRVAPGLLPVLLVSAETGPFGRLKWPDSGVLPLQSTDRLPRSWTV